jgi:CRP-like cAMP-binding protein/uncharacterized protein (DUF2225 family)
MVDLTPFLNLGKVKTFSENEVLFTEHEQGDCMYIPLKGKFGVYINSFTDFPTRVALLGEGHYFGEMSVIDGSPRSATVISEEQGLAVCIEKSDFVPMLENNPEIAMGITKALSERSQATAELVTTEGHAAEELPENLKNPELSDCTFDNMEFLAKRIRDLNFILSGGKKETVEMRHTDAPVNLLPAGHKRFTKKDVNDNKELLVWRYYICPYCGKGFVGKIPLFLKLDKAGTTPDQRIMYKNFNILLYMNIVCPNCNYCDTYAEFGKARNVSGKIAVKGNQFKNTEGFTGFEEELSHTVDEAVLSYYLNLLCLEQVSDSELRMAKAWQRLYWLYGDYQEKELANNAARKALKYYDDYLSSGRKNIQVTEKATINAIISELKKIVV